MRVCDIHQTCSRPNTSGTNKHPHAGGLLLDGPTYISTPDGHGMEDASWQVEALARN